MKNNPPSPRQTALNCLRSWHAGRSFAETLVDRECSRTALPPADRHLVQALVFSVLRNQTWLELEHKYRPWIDFDALPFLFSNWG